MLLANITRNNLFVNENNKKYTHFLIVAEKNKKLCLSDPS